MHRRKAWTERVISEDLNSSYAVELPGELPKNTDAQALASKTLPHFSMFLRVF